MTRDWKSTCGQEIMDPPDVVMEKPAWSFEVRNVNREAKLFVQITPTIRGCDLRVVKGESKILMWDYLQGYTADQYCYDTVSAAELPPGTRCLPDMLIFKQKHKSLRLEKRRRVARHPHSRCMKKSTWGYNLIKRVRERYRGRTEEDAALSLVGHLWRIPSMSLDMIR